MRLSHITALLASVTGALSSCSLPAKYNWTSTGALVQPKNNNWAALKDPTHVTYKGQNLIYATTLTEKFTWGSVVFDPFTDWSQMSLVNQTVMKQPAIAASLFLFRPKDTWIMAYQWGSTTFSFKTSKNPADANGWSSVQTLFTGSIPNSGTGPLHPALIGDDENMYLFFCGDNGSLYMTSMPIGQFPSSFGSASTVVLKDTTPLIFEGVQVYTISPKSYLLIVEALSASGRRFFRSFTATSLRGPWKPQAATESNPFAGNINIDATWTRDVSQGELIRTNPDQTMTIDPCNLQFLYQGILPNVDNPVFGLLPSRLGVLTARW